MEVTKVKVLNAGTTIELEAKNEGHPEPRQLKDCPDRSKELEEALDGLKVEVCRLLGFTTKGMKTRVRVTGVSVSRDANGHRQFVLTTKYRTNVGEASLNVPRLREQVEDEAGETVLSDVQLKRIEKVLAAGLSYYNGQRVQGDLFDSEDEQEAAEG